MVEMREGAYSIRNVQVMKFVRLSVHDNFAEPLQSWLIIIINCIQIPQVATGSVRGQHWFSQNCLKGNSEVIVALRASPFEFSHVVDDIGQMVWLGDLLGQYSLSEFFEDRFVPQPHLVKLLDKTHLLVVCVFNIEVRSGVADQHLEGWVPQNGMAFT